MTITPLPSPLEIKTLLPLPLSMKKWIEQSRAVARQIVQGKDPRQALIVGPCSIHERTSALEYAQKLKELSTDVDRRFFMVMRVYVEKPRTSTGWKGLLYDPHLDGSHDIKTGILWTRELLLALAELGMPCATEFVDPLSALYFEDLITWGFIGARTSSSQPHRQFASAVNFPIGFKNATDGNLDSAIHGVIAAREAHTSMHIDQEGKLCALTSEGNPFSHIVLRGGQEWTNYSCAHVADAKGKLKACHLPSRLMVDCSHGNCQKDYEKQKQVFLSVWEQIKQGDDSIMGMMLESHLESGAQPLTEDLSLLKYAVSITDPCLDWKATEELVYSALS
jgi:3-deoxy-7-phosphoheptulonate synthase